MIKNLKKMFLLVSALFSLNALSLEKEILDCKGKDINRYFFEEGFSEEEYPEVKVSEENNNLEVRFGSSLFSEAKGDRIKLQKNEDTSKVITVQQKNYAEFIFKISVEKINSRLKGLVTALKINGSKETYVASIICTPVTKKKMIGVRVDAIDEKLKEELNLGFNGGVIVLEVIKDSPAEKAGLMAGDIIIKINGKILKSYKYLSGMLSSIPAGKKAELYILREGIKMSVVVEPLERE